MMVLNDVKLMGSNDVFNIGIDGAQISFISNTPFAEFDDRLQLNLGNALAIPGLINSHDHLDFNVFPQLGCKTYSNYVEWGDYIHTNYKEQIDRVLAIPVALRAKWGVYKSLLCGVTTVVDHGIKHDTGEELITVHDHCQSLHSIRLERNWKPRLNNPLKLNIPAVIHIGEGTDKAAEFEIDELIRWNILQRDLIGIHGVAMNPEQAKHFKALVWCPQTNYFLLNKTAPVNALKDSTTVLFGTDSTLTGNSDIWDHIRLARKTTLLSDEELYQSLTTNPSHIWKTNSGQLAEGKDADIVIVKPHVSSFFDITPEDILLVIHHGNIRLFDETLSVQLINLNRDAYSKIEINGTCKYVQGDLSGLIHQIHQYYPEAKLPVTAEGLLSVH
ncbi:MAG: amidohydrolase family protein [Mucilaginibacter sp.]|uniref:amidohydrolase family protein n=1 Tax=Mucilaginibacter sp. TaxID=1882438 RepID=UPI0032653439